MKTRSRSVFLTLFILLPILAVNLACGFSSLAADTPTPTLTLTPLPTNTSTPRPTSTATPNLRATQAAERDQAIRDILTELELPADTGSLGWYQTDPAIIELEGPSGFYQTFAEDVTASDFVMASEFTWDTDSWPVCGVWFRTDDRWNDGDRYELLFLRFSGLPGWDIEYIRNGRFVSNIAEKIRFSDFLSIEDGATNQIVIAAIGNEFKVYINGNFEGRYYDYSKKLSEGQFAFVARQDAGATTCTFDNTWIWLYK